MGENKYWEREVVITELTKGKELFLQLQKHSDPMKQDVCQYLATEILSSYDKALSLLNGTALSGTMMNKCKEIVNPTLSPHLLFDDSSTSCAPPSNTRKRKIVSRRREHVRPRPGEEVPPEDGYSWRKYGQKNIKGAKFPREYYRCSRNVSSKCAATKIVQRSETGPLAFEVSYGESHSCGQENKNQNEELVVVQQTTCVDEVGIGGAGKTFEPVEMVSTPSNPLNDFDFFPTSISSPLPDTDDPLDADFLNMRLRMLEEGMEVAGTISFGN